MHDIPYSFVWKWMCLKENTSKVFTLMTEYLSQVFCFVIYVKKSLMLIQIIACATFMYELVVKTFRYSNIYVYMCIHICTSIKDLYLAVYSL